MPIFKTKHYDCSDEMLLFPSGEGVKLVRPDKVNPHHYNSDNGASRMLLDIFNMNCNVYFLSNDSQIISLNHELLTLIDLMNDFDFYFDKTVFDFVENETATIVCNNDKKVVEQKKNLIVDETVRCHNNVQFKALSFKWPIFNDQQKVVGIFGFSTIYGMHTLGDILQQIQALGLLSANTSAMTRKLNIFSTREQQIAHLLVYGKSAKNIGKHLTLSPRTIEHYIENMKVKSGAYNKADLIEKILSD